MTDTMDAAGEELAKEVEVVLSKTMVYKLNKEGLISELAKRGLQCSPDTTVVRLRAILLGVLAEGGVTGTAELDDDHAVPLRVDAPFDLSRALGIYGEIVCWETSCGGVSSFRLPVGSLCRLFLTINHNKSQVHWDRDLDFLNLAFNSALHESVGASPFSVLLGRDTNHPLLADWDVDPLLSAPNEPSYSESYTSRSLRILVSGNTKSVTPTSSREVVGRNFKTTRRWTLAVKMMHLRTVVV
uniref:Uncharacterized protein n=1 Tax=Timema douglasi TaxID=61478 RepID=A0A7R8ZBU5_TIMDO|nr:unnamed protein product [Timema douglasi]